MADAEEVVSCHGARTDPFDSADGSVSLRIGAIFIILASSGFATLFPILTRRVPRLSVGTGVFDFAKYFGSGVIIATAFMHLLAPGAEELSSPCLGEAFQVYTFAYAFAMIAVFVTFVVEMLAFRLGSQVAAKLAYDPHRGGHHHSFEHNHTSAAVKAKQQEQALLPTNSDGQSAEGKENDDGTNGSKGVARAVATSHSHHDDLEHQHGEEQLGAATSQILGVAILEFGVIFHSFIIGLTLGTTNEFVILFIVIIFHQMFEGLGLGVRLALLPLKPTSTIPWIGAIAYACVTPVGMAVGLGIRNTYNEDSATANYITGTFDSVSAGILLYTGLVELLAHEFIFNDKMRTAPIGKVLLNVLEVLTGAGIMALLARWA